MTRIFMHAAVAAPLTGLHAAKHESGPALASPGMFRGAISMQFPYLRSWEGLKG
jgi:hypothetical protein